MVAILITLFGVCIGSFLNVLIDRLPKGKNVISGRSRCDHCRRILRWYELVPLFSYIFQNGKCRRCGSRLSLQYPIIEASTALIFLITYSVKADSIPGLFLIWALYASLLVIFVADLKYTIIPDAMIVSGILAGLGLAVISPNEDPDTLNRFASAVGGALVFLLIWSLSGGKGIGLGDVKLMLVLGLALGFPLILVSVYTGFLTGAVTGVILILVGKKRLKSHIAFGPFLVLGFIISEYFGEQIITFWSRYIA